MWIGQNGVWSALTSWRDGSKVPWSDAVDGWDSEKKQFIFAVGPEKPGQIVGHYTEVSYGKTKGLPTYVIPIPKIATLNCSMGFNIIAHYNDCVTPQ